MKPDEAKAELQKIDVLIDRNARLPGMVFHQRPHSFRIIEFDELWSSDFFRRAREMTKANGDECFTLAVLQPDPERYFYNQFCEYPFFRFALDDVEQHYVDAINEDPGNSPADAVAHNADVVFVYPERVGWAIYGDRDLEVAVVATMNERALEVLTSIYPRERLHSAASAIARLLVPLYGGAIPEDMQQRFIANYSS